MIGWILLDRSSRNSRYYPSPLISARTSLTFLGMGVFFKDNRFPEFKRISAGEMERFRQFASVAPRQAFMGESLRLCLRRRSKRARIVLTWIVGS